VVEWVGLVAFSFKFLYGAQLVLVLKYGFWVEICYYNYVAFLELATGKKLQQRRVNVRAENRNGSTGFSDSFFPSSKHIKRQIEVVGFSLSHL
jgi:hypothetical protein